MPEPHTSGRADRRRNRTRITTAARTVILTKGRTAGMDEIATEAGLAVGTLYRHFPTKDDLVGAILTELADETDTLVHTYEQALTAPDSDPAHLLEELVRSVVLDLSASRMLRETLDGSEQQLRASRDRAAALLTDIVHRAKADGTLRPDTTADDVILMLRTAPDETITATERERWVHVVLAGLRTP